MKWTFDDQRQCLQLVRQGKTYAEIAEAMGRERSAVGKFVQKMRRSDPGTWRRIAARPSHPQLCWSCRFASRPREDGWLCPWAARLEPVQGWTASTEVKTRYVSGNIKESTLAYSISECPHFEKG